MSLHDNQITRHENIACVIVALRQSSSRRDRQNGHPDCRVVLIQIVALQLDEILTVNRLGLPAKLRRSLACTNSIENMMGTVRRVCRNVKRWRNARMALRWTAAGMMEAAKGFRRLKAYKHLPILKAALTAHHATHTTEQKLEDKLKAA